MKLRELNPILDDHADILVIVGDSCSEESLYNVSGMEKVEFFDTNGDYIVDFITRDRDYDFVVYVSEEAIK